jgi:hypothetical protein
MLQTLRPAEVIFQRNNQKLLKKLTATDFILIRWKAGHLMKVMQGKPLRHFQTHSLVLN